MQNGTRAPNRRRLRGGARQSGGACSRPSARPWRSEGRGKKLSLRRAGPRPRCRNWTGGTACLCASLCRRCRRIGHTRSSKSGALEGVSSAVASLPAARTPCYRANADASVPKDRAGPSGASWEPGCPTSNAAEGTGRNGLMGRCAPSHDGGPWPGQTMTVDRGVDAPVTQARQTTAGIP